MGEAELAMLTGGLTRDEAVRRLARYGVNSLPEPRGLSLGKRLVTQFASPIIWLLLFAVLFDLGIWVYEGAKGIPFESIVIATILILNASMGAYQEYKSDAALSKLKELAAPMVWVIRDGELTHIAASQLVPGDLVRVEAGDRIPADGVLDGAFNILVNESTLTGESAPVEKSSGDQVYSGTQLARGRALVLVTRTGASSALGRIASSLQSIRHEQTPLEEKLNQFGKHVAWWVLSLALLIFVLGITIEGVSSLSRVLLFSVALAVAAVPEGMPAVLTLTLARGIERMAQQKAVVRRMNAVESLGSVTIIATDKTGTLTENKMFVRELISDEPFEAIAAMVLANDADPECQAGDPMELALYAFATSKGLNPAAVREAFRRTDILPFDSANQFMRVTGEKDGAPIHYLKGAPEVIFDRCYLTAEARMRWQNALAEFASSGHRILAFASSDTDSERDCRFLGLALLWDPPRAEVSSAIKQVQDAGVKVVMMTGDHPLSALAIARSIGLPECRVLTGDEIRSLSELPEDVNVFARVLPEDKLRLVEMLKAMGEIVAMTGDGVNDAPALKRAEVGIAMGQRGSDISREVASIVLLDDNFATIVAAIEQGRGIFANIQKFIRFLFSTNLAELIVVTGGALGSVILNLRDSSGALLLPITTAQLLWVNLVTDGPVALALGIDNNPNVMGEPPRSPNTPLLDAESGRFVVFTGVVGGLIALGLLALLPKLNLSPEVVRSGVFHYIVLAQLALAYPSRGMMRFARPNWALAVAVVLGIGIQILVASVPATQAALGIYPLPLNVALVVGGSVVVAWILVEGYIRWVPRLSQGVA